MSNLRPLDRLASLAPWLAGAAAFVLYALAAAPSIVMLFDDSLEFQLVLPTLGIAHPTGYPLYTLLGALWSRVLWPFGNWAWRVNLLSALAAAAAVALVFAIAQRLVRAPAAKHGQLGLPADPHEGVRATRDAPRVPHALVRNPRSPHALVRNPRSPHALVRKPRSPHALVRGIVAGTAAALVFGLGPVWMAQATLAEVYALHNLLLAAVLLVTLWVGEAAEEAVAWRMTLLAALVGLGLAHHRTIVLALPAVAIHLLWRIPGLWRPQRAWLLWLGALLLPLLLYLYIPLRAAAGAVDLNGSYANSWDGFWRHVLARAYSGFFSVSALTVKRTPQEWLALGLAQVGLIGGLLALLGGAALFTRRRRQEWLLVLLVLAANLLFALAYRVGDQEVFLLPVFLCLALLAGGGAALLLQAAARFTPPAAQPLVALALLALVLWNPGRAPLPDRSRQWAVHDYAVDMATVPFPPGALVLGLEGEVTALKYMQAAEGLGLNATPLAADDPPRRAALLAAAVESGAAAYLTRELEGVADVYSFGGDGPLVRAWPRGAAQAGEPQHALDLPMADGALLLRGYDLQQLDWAGGPALRLNLYWQPTTPITQTLKTSIRLLGADGSPLLSAVGTPAVFDQFPLRGVAPTTTWLRGETVRDAYAFYLPPGAQPGAQPVTLQLILYDAGTLAEVGRWEVSGFLPAD